MKRKKNACLKKKSKTVYCCVMYLTGKQLYYSGLCLHYPGHIVKPCLKKKCNEKIIWATRK